MHSQSYLIMKGYINMENNVCCCDVDNVDDCWCQLDCYNKTCNCKPKISMSSN